MKLDAKDEAAIRYLLPERMVGGLLRYIEHGLLPGGFWQAILENDLSDACAHADEENKYRIWDYVYVLYNHTPSDCWGSKQRVMDWIRNKGGTTREKDTTSQADETARP